MGDSGEKVCGICGQSCANQPRMKDAQGRYAHKACFEKKMQERQTTGRALVTESEPVAADVGLGLPEDESWLLPPEPEAAAPAFASGAVGGALGGAAASGIASGSCPGCGYPVTPGAVLCTRCGTNVATGKSLRVKVAKTRPAREPGLPASMAQRGMSIGAAGIGAGVGAGIWMMASSSSDESLRPMTFLVGALAGAGSLVPLRGKGNPISAMSAAVFAILGAGACVAMGPEDVTEGFELRDEEFGYSFSVEGPTEDASGVFGAAWIALAGCAAFGLARTNHEEGLED
ncbi:MAG: hypothetical protein RBS39_11825 [Phycisphaerales bacterium]|jgi:hypothetical protein|nr:hypothetical protein [Phycisphaerales bacterium]